MKIVYFDFHSRAAKTIQEMKEEEQAPPFLSAVDQSGVSALDGAVCSHSVPPKLVFRQKAKNKTPEPTRLTGFPALNISRRIRLGPQARTA